MALELCSFYGNLSITSKLPGLKRFS